jgi:hypothetical protein
MQADTRGHWRRFGVYYFQGGDADGIDGGKHQRQHPEHQHNAQHDGITGGPGARRGRGILWQQR